MSETVQSLLNTYTELPLLDKMLLLSHLLQEDRAFLLTYPEHRLNQTQCDQFHQGCMLRLQGMPLAYITHEAGFLGEQYFVDERVLVPRPETESLVLHVLETLEEKPLRVVDVGTGSGVIALSLQKACPLWEVIAIDCEKGALEVMRINAKRLGLADIQCLHQDGLQRLCGLDCVVSNPPYIDPSDPCLHGDGVRFEPQKALVAGDRGYQVLHQIAAEAFLALNCQGLLAMEHGETQDLSPLLHDLGYGSIRVHQDLMGKNRFTTAVKS